MKTHISKVVSCCHHQLRRIRQVRRLVRQDVAQQLVSAFILSRLDYCNSLSCLPRSTIQPLQRVMNAAARVTMNLLLVVAWPCEASSEAATLAPGRAKNYIQAVSSCITSTLDKHHSTCQTVYPQFLHSTGVDKGRPSPPPNGRAKKILLKWNDFQASLQLNPVVHVTITQREGGISISILV